MRSAPEIRALLRAFLEGTLPESEWHHREHVTIATCFLLESPLPAAIDRMRSGILSLNARHGVVETPTRGYHETLTVVFMKLIDAFLEERGRDLALEVLVHEATERFPDKRVVLEHYTRERINSLEARRGWLEPDLRPLG